MCALALLCRRKSWLIFLFCRPLLIRCFSFYKACTYRSDLMVEPPTPVTDWRAPVILVELDSVAIRWVRQETLLGATLKRIRRWWRRGRYYFHSNLLRSRLRRGGTCCLLLIGRSHSTEENRHFTLSPQWVHQIKITCFLVNLTIIYKLIIIRAEWQWWYLIKEVESGFCSGLF
jgi:hypothetical protein